MMLRIVKMRALVVGAVSMVWLSGCVPEQTGAVTRRPPPEFSLPGYAMIWPSQGPVAARFGPRGADHHAGIDILGEEGHPIRAALDGEVLFVGSLPGYGNVIILQHPNALTTVYAHNQKNQVKEGARVRRGDVIALLGRTGRAVAPNLHFEVRRRNQARDPMQYLPRAMAESAGLDTQSGS